MCCHVRLHVLTVLVCRCVGLQQALRHRRRMRRHHGVKAAIERVRAREYECMYAVICL